MTDQAVETFVEFEEAPSLKREINWVHAVGIATGVPALVLFSIGAIASTVGSPSWLVWILSVLIGSFQMFTYAEVVGMFSNKSGGAAVAGSLAWLPYSKAVPAISAWCYWLAWSPVLAIGTTIASGYILTSFFPATSPINTWQITLIDLNFIQSGLTLRINANFLISAILLLVVFLIQHGGILRAARFQVIFAVASLLPLGIIGILPLLTGKADLHQLLPVVPLAHDAAGKVIPGKWDMAGITLFVGALGLAAWSSYGIEACLVYAREFKRPNVDVIKASLATAALCLFFYAVVPISFQAFLGLSGISDPSIADGSGVAGAMAKMVSTSPMVTAIIVAMLIITLLLSVLTAMSGSSRTLYQASTDGFLPKYLSRANSHGVPSNAMWTDIAVNLVLLLVSNNVFLLAISNVCYLVFNFINLQAGWIHRVDRPGQKRPYKAPTWLIAIGALLGFVNLFFIGMGSNVFGAGVLKWGLITVFLVVPIFLFRHYVVDKGVFPKALTEIAADGSGASDLHVGQAKWLPYLAAAAGVLVVTAGAYLAVN
ncbi:amino acid permease [Methylovirgula ligni]|uniref:Amino acid/polyamine/organocation transporter (APC superfamily) n=1 Tax=Methylovirgula ligni TaxID=569860 RepID=A0A3D9YXQ6_9HYPH|nr:APC family permease [Methylovirgula ligni]QAY94596.1 amino acid permease [Methylovirgula ligni]REF87533.1 amino acid/polyamine/organocation transporter (APC superfamily) [Methylovirgula ligni]